MENNKTYTNFAPANPMGYAGNPAADYDSSRNGIDMSLLN